MNAELNAIRVLAEIVADRLSDEVDARMKAGHGRTDADPTDLAALIVLQADWADASAVACTLRRHTSVSCDA